MKNRFGVEIECISKSDIYEVQHSLAEILNDKMDISTTSYHCHNINKWGVENDGSLHGNDRYPFTMEIISRPLKIHEMGEIKEVLAYLKGGISANHSCGLHVHVEIDSADSIKRVLKIWRKYEENILDAFPFSRRNNSYARPLNSIDIDRMNALAFDRYTMVNVQKYTFSGTLEFRGHSGTTNYHKIKRWILFCMAMVKKGIEYRDHARSLTNALNRDVDMWEFLGLNGKTKNYFEGRKKHFKKRNERG